MQAQLSDESFTKTLHVSPKWNHKIYSVLIVKIPIFSPYLEQNL